MDRLIITSLSLVLNISNPARVSIINTVGHNLGTAIRKNNRPPAIGSIVVTVLIGTNGNTRVGILDIIVVVVLRRDIISWLLVAAWAVRWSRLNDRGRLVGRCRPVGRGRLVGAHRLVAADRLIGLSNGVSNRLGMDS